MSVEEKRQLLAALEAWLVDIDRHAGCSDRFFRQVYSTRVKGFLATGLLEKLRDEIEAIGNRGMRE